MKGSVHQRERWLGAGVSYLLCHGLTSLRQRCGAYREGTLAFFTSLLCTILYGTYVGLSSAEKGLSASRTQPLSQLCEMRHRSLEASGLSSVASPAWPSLAEHRALLLAPMHLLMVLMFSLRRVLIEILRRSNQKWGKAGWELLSFDTAKGATVSAQAA